MVFKDLKQQPLTIKQKKAFIKQIDSSKFYKASAKKRIIKELLRVKIKKSKARKK